MIGRVTQQGLQFSALRNLQQNLGRMSDLQLQLSSGKVITKASDDPAGMVDAMRIRSDRRANTQHARNVQDGVGWLTTVDSAVNTSLSLLRRARDLTVQAGNSGALSDSAREAIAIELEQTAEALREQANAQYLGRSVFAGTSNAGEAFTNNGDGTYAFNGTPGAAVERRVADNTAARVDSVGTAVFGVPGDTVFETLNMIAAGLRSGTPPTVPTLTASAGLDAIDNHMNAMLKEVASVGARTNQIENAREAIADRKVMLDSQLSDVEDADLAATIVELQMQEVAYASALNATSRALQPSLLDFLR
ncbi:flagellar hook-associated protein 3 [Georgenia yuyongxinii]|uniref:Flagellar hook-associated protein 3 n=1 Tax=Georgenia yuyongxinii TaxID=2589797 RepID=A0A5B8BZC0_9MICO|nr:flagellar hook-associated protein FlgL [Georgenia yuyongxinii]QDC23628.1 flagellar hook-associated protein 3 [Georgenia yuyongxinii]